LTLDFKPYNRRLRAKLAQRKARRPVPVALFTASKLSPINKFNLDIGTFGLLRGDLDR
jgi:hypothetical protein